MSEPQGKRFSLRGPEQYHTILSSVYVEGGLALLAFVIGYFIQFSPVRTLKWSFRDVFLGLAATFPMLLLYVFLDRLHVAAFRKIRRLVQFFVETFFRKCSTFQIILICALAGIGEELFFRGILHDAVAHGIGGIQGVVIGVLISAFFFGIAHMVTPTYGIIAFFISIYFSLLLIFSDNILIPIIAHGVYDYCVIHYILERRQKRLLRRAR